MQYQLSFKNGAIALQEPQRQGRQKRGEASTFDKRVTRSFKRRSSLLILPPEIRLIIYRHLLVHKELVHRPICRSTDGYRIVPIFIPLDRRCPIPKFYPEILKTCRLINQEATPILYGENTFTRSFYWPRKLGGGYDHWDPFPLRETSLLNAQNLHSISRIELSQGHSRWLVGDGELKILRDFPSLRELHLKFILRDYGTSSLDLKTFWLDMLKAASRKPGKLRRLRLHTQLFMVHNFPDWIDPPRSWPGEECYYRTKEDQFKKWMEDEGLFPGRKVSLLDGSNTPSAASWFWIELVLDNEHDTGEGGR